MSDFLDQLRAASSGQAGTGPTPRRRVAPSPAGVPVHPLLANRPTPPAASEYARQVREGKFKPVTSSSSDGGGGGFFSGVGDIFGTLGGAAMGVINVADVARRGLQGAAGELGDWVEGQDWIPGGDYGDFVANMVVGNPFQLRGGREYGSTEGRDTSFDIGNIWDGINSDMSWGGLQQQTDWDESLPGPAQAVIGFAGDVVTDPTTYVGGGLVKNAVAPGVKAAAIPATRKALAQEVAQRATKAGLSLDEVRDVTRAVGSRGRGGLTSRSVAELGLDEDIIKKLELDPDFGLQVRAGGSKANIPATKGLSESIEYSKGRVKEAIGGSAGGRAWRQLFTSSKYGERMAKQAVLSGDMAAPEAAVVLSAINKGRATGHTWVGQAAHELQKMESRGLKKSKQARRQMTEMLDGKTLDQITDPEAVKLRKWFDDQAKNLQDMGVEFNYRPGYVPHRLTERAHRALQAGDPDVLAASGRGTDLERAQRFQMIRDDGRTIAERNAEFRNKHGYDLLETDVNELVGQYLNEGLNSVMDAQMLRGLPEEAGLVKPLTETVDEARLFDDARGQAKAAVDSAVREGRRVAKAAEKESKQLAKQKAGASAKLTDEIQQMDAAVAKATDDVAAAERQVATLEQALSEKEALLRKAKGKEKAALTREIKEMQSEIQTLRSKAGAATKRYNAAKKNRRVLGAEQKAARASLEEAKTVQAAAKDQRALMDAQDELASFSEETQELGGKVARDQERLARSRDEFMQASERRNAAEYTADWLGQDMQAKVARLDNEIDDIAQWRSKMPKAASRKTRDRLEFAEVLENHLRYYKDVLEGTGSPASKQIASLEAQAVIAEARLIQDGAEALVKKRDFQKWIDIVGEDEFQKYVSLQADDGFEVLARKGIQEDVQISKAYKEMFDPGEINEQILNQRSEFFKAWKKTASLYQKALSWWKGWALGTPGFLMRNLYTGMFNAYLDNVPQKALLDFGRFNRKAQKDGIDAARDWAATRWNPERANRLVQAREAAAATGWGITVEEGREQLVGASWKLNPASRDFAPLMAIRAGSSDVEAALRGGHALAILERGGSFDEAIDRVTKFHFNYRDIGDFDRAVKNVSPFWTFFSRNMALQAEVFATRPDKLSRSYFNAKRNFENWTGEDSSQVAEWQRRLNPMPTNLPVLGNVNIDVPSAQWPAQLAELEDNPLDFAVQQLGPGVGTAAELAMGRDTFRNRDFRDEYTQWRGQEELRKAPFYMQVPGMEGVLSMLPGVDQVGGDVIWTDRAESYINEFNPMLNRASSLASPDSRGRSLQSMVTGMRPWDPNQVYDNGLTPRQAEEAAAQRDAQRAAQERALLELLAAQQ